MKNILFSAILLLLIACGCSEDSTDHGCSVSDPVGELQWLKDYTAEIAANESWRKDIYIEQGLYDNKTVFVYGNCCVACIYAPMVWNCAGDTLDILPENVSDRHVIWKTDDNQCSL